MKSSRFGALVAAGVAACAVLTACDNGAVTPPPAAVAEAAAVETAAVPTEKPLGGTIRWSATNGGTFVDQGVAGKATLTGTSILFVVAEKAPVAAGETITIKAMLTAPANRPIRLYAMRHCDNGNGDDVSIADFVGTGAPIPVEVSHTFKAAYGCMRLSVTPQDKQPVDIELSDIKFLKVTGP